MPFFPGLSCYVSVFTIMLCGFTIMLTKKQFPPHFLGLFSPKIHRQVIATEIRLKQRCLFVYRGAQLSLRKDELALNSILVKVKNFALALCSMLGQGGQQLLKVVGHLAIMVGKRPMASSNF